MLLGLYGPATTFVPPYMTMDIRFNRRLQLHISLRPMTTSTTCGLFGAPCRSSCSRIRMVHPVDVNRFQGQAVHRLRQQHIQLGLRKGMAVLVYYRVQSGPHVNEVFQAVLIAHESVANRGKKTDNKLWKRVSRQRRSLHGYPPTLHGPFAVMPYVGEGTVNIWPFMKRTWGCRDVLSRRTFSLWIWCSLVTQEVLKSLLFSPTWPRKGCVWGRAEEKFTPIFPVSGDHCLLLL